MLFVIAAVYAVLRPDDTTVVANWLGVDRGADLIGYVLIIAFVFTTLSTYMRFKDLELRYARLARAVALQGARVPDDAEGHSFGSSIAPRACVFAHDTPHYSVIPCTLADQALCSSRKNSTVLAIPSWSFTLGVQPRTASARLMSRHERRRSPSLGG